MKLPLLLVTYLPAKLQHKYIKHRWSLKSNAIILSAFEDATGWIDISLGRFCDDTTIKIANDCIMRLELYILPEMRKRGLI